MTLIRRILVPTDFSDSARQALDWASTLAREFKAEILLLHVVENLTVGYASDLFPVPMAEVYEEISGYARTELAKLAEELRTSGVAVTERLAQGTPSAEIIRIAKEEPVDLIVRRLPRQGPARPRPLRLHHRAGGAQGPLPGADLPSAEDGREDLSRCAP